MLLKFFLFFYKFFEPPYVELLNLFDVEAQVFCVLLLQLRLFFSYQKFIVFVIYEFDNHRIFHNFEELNDCYFEFLNFWEVEDYIKLDPALFVFLPL